MNDFLLHSLEKMLNQYLSLDPESGKRLHALNGKVITLDLTGVALRFQLKILHNKVHVQKHVQTEDVFIQGTPISLLHLSLADKRTRRKFFAEDVLIQGDLELGQQVIDLFDEMEIDWEEHLSKITGDVVAHQVGRFVRSTKNFLKRACAVGSQNINEYVHEEVELFPPGEALQDFFEEIDEVRMNADRLEQKIKQLHRDFA